MKKIVTGILAHVDAGKTTLSEGLLYTSGMIRKIGRVDNGDAFLDTNQLEKARGITIFSKQAILTMDGLELTILDTPGHVDFSAEMERTLQVLDYAILVISGADGVQGHTLTLWRLLKRYQIPVFLFVNKMDQPGTDREAVMAELKKKLSDGCIDFSNTKRMEFFEEVAMEDETTMEHFLEYSSLNDDMIIDMIEERKVFPCFFGSALKLQGLDMFLSGLERFVKNQTYQDEFGAKVYKISRDEQNNRLTYLKITGGSLKVKASLTNEKEEKAVTDIWEEKVNQIRIYSGTKYEAVNEVCAGTVCAVTGLEHTYPGEGLGAEADSALPVLEPVLTYQVILPEGLDAAVMLPKLRQLEEEEPELHIIWDEKLQEIQAQIMGKVQIEILKDMILERYGVEVAFGTGNIVYKETITNTVEGVGHFEPLRHYAEVHLLLEPAENGSGIQIASDCSEDLLDKNWQRLIMTHLEEKEYLGVLTGSVITDMKITLIGGRAHTKHTEGGDFRQATYRAVRQGLMQAQSMLLEPFYEFRLEIPQDMVGRAMTDIEKMNGRFEGPYSEGEISVLTGTAPVACMNDYQMDVIAYSKGHGKLSLSFAGYFPCHNAGEVIVTKGYDSERDTANSPDSVFCAHGAGFIVPWDEVTEYMHVEGRLLNKPEEEQQTGWISGGKSTAKEIVLGTEEIDEIIARTYHANKHDKGETKRWAASKKVISTTPTGPIPARRTISKEEYLLVDGYNIIFAWEELKELAAVNIDGARGLLLDILSNYQGIKKCNLIVVFDAYRVKGHQTELFDYHNIHVVYTKEAETADAYIEKFAHENGRRFQVTVATSDGLEQIIITGQGCRLFSAREFEKEVAASNVKIRELLEEQKEKMHNYLIKDALEEKTVMNFVQKETE